MNPGCTKAIEGIQNVEKMTGTAELDSGDEGDELGANNAEGVSIEEVR